jgi:hypothetical protein
VPKVTRKIRCILLLLCGGLAYSPMKSKSEDAVRGPANTLYERLRTATLDAARVYKIREASLDRSSIHISLNDGIIAFTVDVAGRITGAFFSGDGEVLLSPPNQIERSSMALFTRAAILEEKFSSAYFRFNDDMFNELQASLRPAENPAAFVAQWGDNARGLAEDDALRLLVSFSRALPTEGVQDAQSDPNDRMLHVRVKGLKLGVFDLFFDSLAREQVSAGQVRRLNGRTTYDVWASFASKPTQQGDTASEIAGENEDRGGVEVLHYLIEAEIKPPTELEAAARLQLVAHTAGARTILFELSRYLKVREVTADGIPVEFIHNPSLDGTQLDRRGDDLVAVVLPAPLQVGQKIQLQFQYGGPVLSEAGGGLLYVGARGTWYPNRGFAKAAFDLQFKYPAGWTLVATGKKKEATVPSEHSMQTSRWISEHPIPVAGFNLGKYSRITRHAGPVSVDVYAAPGMENAFPRMAEEKIEPEPPVFPLFPWHRDFPASVAPMPPSPLAHAQAVGDEAARAVTFFADRFGPFPYGDLSLTQMPGSTSQGWPGLIFLSSFSFLTADQKAALHMSAVQQTASDGVIAHETAHQWWGDSVTWNSYRDQWIVEALANYSSLMLLESSNPTKFRALMEKYRDDLLSKNESGSRIMDAGPVTLGARLNSSVFVDGYETIAYERGTWLFHMLRTMMGDGESKTNRYSRTSNSEPFLQALRIVRERYQTKPISIRDLLRVFEEHLPRSSWHDGKKSLDWFYQGWINGTAIPALELHNLKYTAKPNSTIVAGIIKQKDAPDDLITSVPIYALRGGKNVFLGTVFADGPETQFQISAPFVTRKLLIDPDRTVLSRFR